MTSRAGTLVLPQVVLELIEQQPRIAGDPRVFATAGSLASPKQDLDRRLKAALGESDRKSASGHEPTARPERN